MDRSPAELWSRAAVPVPRSPRPRSSHRSDGRAVQTRHVRRRRVSRSTLSDADSRRAVGQFRRGHSAAARPRRPRRGRARVRDRRSSRAPGSTPGGACWRFDPWPRGGALDLSGVPGRPRMLAREKPRVPVRAAVCPARRRHGARSANPGDDRCGRSGSVIRRALYRIQDATPKSGDPKIRDATPKSGLPCPGCNPSDSDVRLGERLGPQDPPVDEGVGRRVSAGPGVGQGVGGVIWATPVWLREQGLWAADSLLTGTDCCYSPTIPGEQGIAADGPLRFRRVRS